MSNAAPKLSEIYASIKDKLVIDGKNDYSVVESLVRDQFKFTLPNDQVWKLVNHHKKQTVTAVDDL